MSTSRTNPIGSANWTPDTIDVKAADVVPAQIAGADPERAAVTITNDRDSTGDLYLIPQQSAKRGGVRLTPGAGFVLATTAPVYGYAVAGDAKVYVVSESGTDC